MEHLLRALPARSQSLLVRYGATTIIVGICFLALIGVSATSGLNATFVLYAAIFLAAILFDRGSGFYAAALSTVLLYFWLRRADHDLLPQHTLLPLLVFAVMGAGLATVSEGLRRAWERAVAAEQAKDVLLQELGHRTRNNLAMAISVLSLQARSAHNPESRSALDTAIARIRTIASAHDHFEPRNHDGRIDMPDYLEKLCGHLGDNLRDVRPIAVKVAIDPIVLRAEHAIPIGLIVNELVTNALKYAFPDDRAGSVRVRLEAGPPVTLTVEDDGVGCPPSREPGIGSRLITLLVQQLGGAMTREEAGPGCRVRVALAATSPNLS
jgi:two-component sensor histidine kinase